MNDRSFAKPTETGVWPRGPTWRVPKCSSCQAHRCSRQCQLLGACPSQREAAVEAALGLRRPPSKHSQKAKRWIIVTQTSDFKVSQDTKFLSPYPKTGVYVDSLFWPLHRCCRADIRNALGSQRALGPTWRLWGSGWLASYFADIRGNFCTLEP